MALISPVSSAIGMNSAGLIEAAVGPLPAHQRLDRDDRAARRRRPAAGNGAANSSLAIASRKSASTCAETSRLRSKSLVNQVQRILPPVFERVHRHVRLAQQVGRVVRSSRVLRDRPMLAPMLSWRSSISIGLPRRSSSAAARAFEDVAGDRADHHDGELVAAQAIGARFLAAQARPAGARAFLDQLVADEVAVMVVDRLEAVEVDQRQGDLVVGFGEAGDVEVDRAAVGQPAEAVGQAEQARGCRCSTGRCGRTAAPRRRKSPG